jgi:hypothetical protein
MKKNKKVPREKNPRKHKLKPSLRRGRPRQSLQDNQKKRRLQSQPQLSQLTSDKSHHKGLYSKN